MKLSKITIITIILTFFLASSVILASGQQAVERNVILADSSIITASKYLKNQEYQELKGVEQIAEICKENPELFLALVLKSTSIGAFESVTLEMLSNASRLFPMDEIVQAFDEQQNSDQKLAYVFINLLIFVDQIQHQVVTHVWNELNRQFESDEIWSQIGTEAKDKMIVDIHTQIKQQLKVDQWKEVYSSVAKNLDRELVGKTSGFVRKMFQLKLRTPVLPSITKNLSSIDFSSSYRDGTLDAKVKLASYYSSMVFQLGLLSMQNSDSFTYLQKKTIRLVQKNKKIDPYAILEELSVALESVSDEYPDAILKKTINNSLYTTR